MKLIRTFLLFILSPLLSTAQLNVDSLRQQVTVSERMGNISDLGVSYSNLAWQFSKLQQYDSAINYYNKALNLKDNLTNLSLVASNLNEVGVIYSKLGMPDSSIHFLHQALQIYQQLKDTVHSSITASNLSVIYKDKGLYENALEYAFMAMVKLEKQQEERALASCYNTIGLIYLKIGDRVQALNYAYKALDVRKRINYLTGVSQSYNNLGEIYLRFNQYDSALVNLFKALELKRAAKNNIALLSTLNNIGIALLAVGKENEAERHFRESLSINQESKDLVGQAIALNSMAKIRWREKDYPTALEYLTGAEKLIRQIGALAELKESLELRIKIYQAKNNYPEAFQSSQELILVKDSLLNQEKIESLLSMQARYETQKKEHHIEMLEQRNQIHEAKLDLNKIWIRVLIFGIIVLVAIAIFVYYSLRSMRRNKLKVELLLKELHHRVKNNLQILSSVLSLQSRELSDQNALYLVKSSESRVNAMALIHRKLYSGDQNREINIKEYVTELVNYLVHTYGYAQKELNVELTVEEIYVDVDKAIPLGLIINELVSNSFKYAYEHSPHPALKVELHRKNSGNLFVRISDNGIGIQKNIQKSLSESFGLKMVGILIKELKGKLETEIKNGTTFALHIPLIR